MHRIFDDTPDMSSVYRYLGIVEHRLGAGRVGHFKRRLRPLREACEQLRPVRNLLMAHTSVHRTAEELFKTNNPFKLVDVKFVQDLATLLNELRDEAGIQQAGQVTTDGRYPDAARGAVSALIYGLPMVEKNGLIPMRTQIPG